MSGGAGRHTRAPRDELAGVAEPRSSALDGAPTRTLRPVGAPPLWDVRLTATWAPDGVASAWDDAAAAVDDTADVEVLGWGESDDGACDLELRVAADDAAAAEGRAEALMQEALARQGVRNLELRAHAVPADDENDESEGPLRYVRVPLAWDAYELDDGDRVLRLFFTQGGTAYGPSHDIAELVLAESAEVVSVTLFERAIAGTYPDGAIAAEPLAAVSGCLEVALSGPLRHATPIDGSTG